MSLVLAFGQNFRIDLEAGRHCSDIFSFLFEALDVIPMDVASASDSVLEEGFG